MSGKLFSCRNPEDREQSGVDVCTWPRGDFYFSYKSFAKDFPGWQKIFAKI